MLLSVVDCVESTRYTYFDFLYHLEYGSNSLEKKLFFVIIIIEIKKQKKIYFGPKKKKMKKSNS